MPSEGMKADGGKAPISRGFARYFPRAIEGVAFISQFGYEKYKEWGGWKKVPDAYNRYDDAHARHDNALQRGETYCPESHKLHLAHRAWNAMATYELYLIEEEAKRSEATLEVTVIDCGKCKTDTECANRGYCMNGKTPLIITAVTELEKVLYSVPVADFAPCKGCTTPKECSRWSDCSVPVATPRSATE